MDVVTAASAKATNKAINPQTVGASNQQVNKHAELQRAANEQRQIDFRRQRRTYFIRKVQAFACFICITTVYIILCGVVTSGDWAKRDVSSEFSDNSSTMDLLGLIDANGFSASEDVSPYTGYCYCKAASSARCTDVGNGFGGLSALCLGLIGCELVALVLLLWEAAFYGRFGGSTTLANLVTIFLLMSLATAALSLSAVYMIMTYSFCKGAAFVEQLVRPGTAVLIRVLETVLLGIICTYAAARSGSIIKSRSVGNGSSSSRYHGGPRGLLLTLLLILIPMTLHSTLSLDWFFYDPNVAEEARYTLSGSNITAPYQADVEAAVNGAVRKFGVRSTCQCTHPCVREVAGTSGDSVDIGPSLGAWWPDTYYLQKTRVEVRDIMGSSSLYAFTSIQLGSPLGADDMAVPWTVSAMMAFDETLPVAPRLAHGTAARSLYESSASIALEVGVASTSKSVLGVSTVGTEETVSTTASAFFNVIRTIFTGAPSNTVPGTLGYTTFPSDSPFNASISSDAISSTSWRPHFMFLWVLLLLQVSVAFFTLLVTIMRVVDNEGKSVIISQVLGSVLAVLMLLTMIVNFATGPPSTAVTCPAYGTFDPTGVASKIRATWENEQLVYGQHNTSAVVPVFTKLFIGHIASYIHASAMVPVFFFLVLNGWYLKQEKLGYHDVRYVRRRYHSWWWEVLQDPRTMAIEERQMAQLEGDTSSDEGSSDDDNAE